MERTVICALRLETDDAFGFNWVVFDSPKQGHIEIKFLELEKAIWLGQELLSRERTSGEMEPYASS